MDLRLANARVLVTAASRGLGAATARRFSLEGSKVAICSRNLTHAHNTAAQIQTESDNPVFPFVADVSDPESAQKVVQLAADALGGLDILVTNAGGPPPGTFDTTPPEAWDTGIQLTLLSTVNLIRAALPYLRESERAAILTITSLSVKQPVANLLLSNSLRGAVIGLTKTLANEIGPEGIRVNSILPGWTRTERVDEIMATRAAQKDTTAEAEVAAQAATIPLVRMATPEEFANVAVFLCSPAAAYIHGAMIPVDGGAIQATL